ncbi:MAG: OmpA family protein [Bacteroidia bacterium]
MINKNYIFLFIACSFIKTTFGQIKTPQNFYEDSALCKVVEIIKGINTKNGEYSPVYYKDHLLFVREKKKKPLRLFSGYRKEEYSVLYSSEVDDSVSYFNISRFNKHIQGKYTNGPLCFTPDDSIVYYTRSASVKLTKKNGKDRKLPLKKQIFYSAMNSYGLAHEEIHPFVYNSFDYNCMHPAFSPDGKRMYFASDMPGTLGGTDIFVCEWKDGAWDKPKSLGPEINTGGNEMYPHVTEDGILYFASDTRPGMGGWDIFYADPANNGSFSEAENAGSPINTEFDDFGIFTLRKTNKGYLSSNRKNKLKDVDIYYFVNNKPRSFPAQIKFEDFYDHKSLSATFTITAPSGKTEARVDSGKYYTTRVKPGKDITIEAGADKYLPKIMLKNISSTDTIITVMLNPRSRKCIEGKIFDKDDNKALAGVKVAIYDEDGNKYLDQVTDSSGTYSICNLPLDKALYIGSQKKPEYFSNTDKFFIRKDSDLVKNIYALKIVVGKAIKVDNIYFDKGKYNVRPDAALELDKLVRLMKDNPEVIIELSSHTDCNGPAASNLTLSDKRAKSAAAYIISKSIDSKRIKGKGYGESKLVNDCKCEGKKPSPCSEEQHAQNRRVEIKVTGFVVEKPAVTPAKVTKKKK